MPLEPDILEANLATAFRRNFKDGKKQNWDSDRAADELAKAIAEAVHTYVGAGQIIGLQTTVRDPGDLVIGSGTQTDPVALS